MSETNHTIPVIKPNDHPQHHMTWTPREIKWIHDFTMRAVDEAVTRLHSKWLVAQVAPITVVEPTFEFFNEFKVQAITTAYEQGVGHAFRDELSNPYPLASQTAMAWDMGRKHGRNMPPIPMVLYCPSCGTQHIDRPNEWSDENAPCDPPNSEMHPDDWAETDRILKAYEAQWTNPPHRSHLCAKCKTIWRPADVATTGVAAITTKGKADTFTPGQAVVPDRKEHAANRTLERLGYTYNGGELWRPPIGPRPEWLDQEDEPLPSWATGMAHSSMDLGAQLTTRDGRVCGNAVVIECVPETIANVSNVKVLTDAGNTMTLCADEINERFYPARWVMDPNTAPGMKRHEALLVDAKIQKYLDAEDNGIPVTSSESDFYILEHALQAGFEMIDGEGHVYICNSRQLVDMVKPYKDAALACRSALEIQIQDAFRESGMSTNQALAIMGGKLLEQSIEKLPGILSAMKAWKKP